MLAISCRDPAVAPITSSARFALMACSKQMLEEVAASLVPQAAALASISLDLALQHRLHSASPARLLAGREASSAAPARPLKTRRAERAPSVRLECSMRLAPALFNLIVNVRHAELLVPLASI
jgi:hypothetical protein